MRPELNFNKVSKFIKRLYKVVGDDSIRSICWSEDGRSIRIVNKEEFLKQTLNYLSKTKEYSAFVRQLNIYGFLKIKSINNSIEEYYHRNFIKGREDLLALVKRDKDKQISILDKSNFKGNNTQLQDALEYLTTQNYKLENDIDALRDRVEKQECTINGLIEILSRMFRMGAPNEDTSISLVDNKVPQQPSPEYSMYNMAKNNFELKKYINNYPTKQIKGTDTKSIQTHKDVFPDSTSSSGDEYDNDFF